MHEGAEVEFLRAHTGAWSLLARRPLELAGEGQEFVDARQHGVGQELLVPGRTLAVRGRHEAAEGLAEVDRADLLGRQRAAPEVGQLEGSDQRDDARVHAHVHPVGVRVVAQRRGQSDLGEGPLALGPGPDVHQHGHLHRVGGGEPHLLEHAPRDDHLATQRPLQTRDAREGRRVEHRDDAFVLAALARELDDVRAIGAPVTPAGEQVADRIDGVDVADVAIQEHHGRVVGQVELCQHDGAGEHGYALAVQTARVHVEAILDHGHHGRGAGEDLVLDVDGPAAISARGAQGVVGAAVDDHVDPLRGEAQLGEVGQRPGQAAGDVLGRDDHVGVRRDRDAAGHPLQVLYSCRFKSAGRGHGVCLLEGAVDVGCLEGPRKADLLHTLL